MPRNEKLTIIYDLETSGFAGCPTFSDHHKILQICAVALETNEWFISFVDPQFKGGIPPWSSLIHNIKDCDVEGAPTIEVALERMYRRFNFSFYKQVEFIAHNTTYFDTPMILKEYKNVSNQRYHLPKNIVFWDTLPFARKEYPHLKEYNLNALYKHFFQEEIENAHRADADVYALKALYEKFFHKARMMQAEPTDFEVYSATVVKECLTTLRFMGPYRARLCSSHGIETVSQLKDFARKLVSEDRISFEAWVSDVLLVNDVTQRAFIVAQALELPIWSDDLKVYLSLPSFGDASKQFWNEEDYYMYYRFVIGPDVQVPNKRIYDWGLQKILYNQRKRK